MLDRRAIKFENKIPLTWLLSSGGTVLALLLTVLWNVATQSNKLDTLISQVQKLDRANEVRDAKIEAITSNFNEAKRNEEIMKMRLDTLEKGSK